MMMSDSKLLKAHLPCSMCGSSDAYATYDDGHGYCHSCEGRNNWNGDYQTKPKEQTNMTLSKGKYSAIPDRNISEGTALFYGVSSDDDRHIYPYSDQSGQWVSNKIRRLPKQFSFEGESRGLQLFGQVKFNRGGKYVTITEGELDALSAYELLGSKFPVVSVRSSSSAYKDCKENFEWLDSFQHIVLAFDADKAGQEASKNIAELFGHKVKTMKMDKQLKDASNYLKNKMYKDFSQHWWSAEEHKPDGVVSGKDLWDRISKDVTVDSVPYPWDELQSMTYGMRLGEMITLTAGSGMGKTQVLRELFHHILSTTNYNIGGMFLEETVDTSGKGLMSIDASIPFHLPDAVYTQEDLRSAFESTLALDRVEYYDSFGSNQIGTILTTIKYFAKAKDCKYIFLDHISILVSDQQSGDERKALDELATKLKTLTMELNICLIMVSHAKRQSTKAHEEGGKTSLSDLRGTAAIGQLSNMVFGLERDGQSDDTDIRDTTLIRVLKNRFSGLTGPSSMLKYSQVTGRLSEITWDQATDPEAMEDEGST
tara:strand:+ start:315 stop:1934 length:1620 start_codon:yes stop_codon:yes gene_type:complete